MAVGLLSFGYNPVTFPATFLGNPNVTITAINTSGGIVTSRDSDGSTYQAPFFIQASASAISATGTSAPYEDLEYQWIVSGAGGDTFTRPTDGATVNSFNSQTGPEAAFAFRSAGNYTITLAIRGKNGGGYTTATVTKNITVLTYSPTNTFYFDPSAGGTNSGTLANPFNSMASLNSAINANPSNTRVLFNRGTHYTGSVGLALNVTGYTGLRFDAYGSGAIPILEITSGASPVMALENGGSSSPALQQDIVFSNITFLNSGAADQGSVTVSAAGNASATMKNIYFDNCTISLTKDGNSNHPAVLNLGGNQDLDLCYNFGLWNTDITNPTSTTTISMAIQGSSKYWQFHIGGNISGAGEDPVFDHHIYNDVKTHGLYKWINFGSTGSGTLKRNFCINGNWDGPRGVFANSIAQYHVYAENLFQGTLFGFDLGNATNNTSSSDDTVQFQYVVAEGNAFKGVDNAGFGCGLSVTIRDNRYWAGSRGDFYNPVGSGQVASVAQNTHYLGKFYRNKLYVPSSASIYTPVSFPDSGWTTQQYITDNIFVDARTSATMVRFISTDFASASCVVDRNTYYSAGGDTTFLTNNLTDVTFSTWQGLGWDASGSSLASNTLGWTLPVTQWSDMN
jgi:hypothetical protein